MGDCIFCRIVSGEIPAAKIYEDEEVMAFLDINPVRHGHALVIPKKHYPRIEEAPDGIVSTVFICAKKLMTPIRNAMNADYVALSVIGVDVNHLHIHLIPRNHDDGLASFWPTTKYSGEEMEKVRKKIESRL